MTDEEDQALKGLIITWRKKADIYLDAAEELEDNGRRDNEEYLVNVECAKVFEVCASDLQRVLAADLSKVLR